MTTLRKFRGILDVDKDKIVDVENRATAMHDGMAADTATYTAPNPPLPAFLVLIQNLGTCQQAALRRAIGAAALRDDARDLLWTAMQTELAYINSLAAASPSRAVSIIQNGGCVVADVNPHTKAIIELSLVLPAGTVACDANVGLLLGPGAKKPSANRFFNWGYTLDNGKNVPVRAPDPQREDHRLEPPAAHAGGLPREREHRRRPRRVEPDHVHPGSLTRARLPFTR
jgi:hypothetical protein